jgi:hypothetical protein
MLLKDELRFVRELAEISSAIEEKLEIQQDDDWLIELEKNEHHQSAVDKTIPSTIDTEPSLNKNVDRENSIDTKKSGWKRGFLGEKDKSVPVKATQISTRKSQTTQENKEKTYESNVKSVKFSDGIAENSVLNPNVKLDTPERKNTAQDSIKTNSTSSRPKAFSGTIVEKFPLLSEP